MTNGDSRAKDISHLSLVISHSSSRPSLSRNTPGYLFMLMAMWYAGASQSNGAAFLLFFLLLGVVITSVPQAFANLRGLRAASGSIKPAFAGQEITLPVEVMNESRKAAHSVTVELPGLGRDAQVVDEILPGSAAWVTLHIPVEKRGEHEIAGVQLSSTFPVGALKVRRGTPLGQKFLVYPRPAGDSQLPRSEAVSAHRSEGPQLEGDDFAGVRSYVLGESQRHVDWKAVARGQPMMTKQFSSESEGTLHFDYSTLPMRNVEARLSQLALWIIEAERARRRYSLRLPGNFIPESIGESHSHKCLRALALFS